MKEIEKFTPSQVQKRPADLYREVESEGVAIIRHRDRKDMYVLTIREYRGLLRKSYEDDMTIEALSIKIKQMANEIHDLKKEETPNTNAN